MKFVPRELKETRDISRGSGGWRATLKNALSVVIVLVVIYFGLGLLAGLIASNIPEKWEAGLLWSGFKPGTSPEFERAERIFKQLLEEADLRPLPYRLFLVDVKDANAIALPGGGVGVTRGLLEEVTSEAGMAMVLAHELGHHDGRHCLKRLGRVIILRGALALVFGDGGSSVLGGGLHLAESGYSRQQEREADEYGLRLVRRTYGHTDGCLEFFEMMRREYDTESSRWMSLMASHPFLPDRIENLRNLALQLDGDEENHEPRKE